MAPAISPIAGRLVKGGSVFLPVKVQRTGPLPKYQLAVRRLIAKYSYKQLENVKDITKAVLYKVSALTLYYTLSETDVHLLVTEM